MKNEKRKYDLSRAAMAQRRRNARARKGKGRDWITVKVDAGNKEWAKSRYGSVDSALAEIRKKEEESEK